MGQRVTPSGQPQPMPWEEGAERRHGSLLDHLRHMLQHLSELRRVQDQHAYKQPISQAIQLAAFTPFVAARRGYRYLRVHASASAVLTVDAGAGAGMHALMTGWNNWDLPEGARVTCAPATNVVIEWTDYTPAPAS